MLIIQFFCNNNRIYECDYLFIEEIDGEEYFIHLYGISSAIDIKVSRLEIRVSLKNKNDKTLNTLYEVSLFGFKPFMTELDNTLCLKSKINFSDDYYLYDQNVVDLLYSWVYENPIRLNKYIITTELYNFTSLIFSGTRKFDKYNNEIIVKGKEITNYIHFYNVLAYSMLGYKKYLASNLDALYDSLSKNKELFKLKKNRIIISDYSILESTLDMYKENYLKNILTIFKEFNFFIKKLN